MSTNQKKTVPQSAPVREAAPMEMEVKIHSLSTSGSVLANASVTLNGCFAVRGIKVINGENGPFVSMPSYKGRDGYHPLPAGVEPGTEAKILCRELPPAHRLPRGLSTGAEPDGPSPGTVCWGRSQAGKIALQQARHLWKLRFHLPQESHSWQDILGLPPP